MPSWGEVLSVSKKPHGHRCPSCLSLLCSPSQLPPASTLRESANLHPLGAVSLHPRLFFTASRRTQLSEHRSRIVFSLITSAQLPKAPNSQTLPHTRNKSC